MAQVNSVQMASVKNEMAAPGGEAIPVTGGDAHPLADSWLSLDDFVEPIRHAGGSMQFIQEYIQKWSRDVLAQRLDNFFERKPDLMYSDKEVLQRLVIGGTRADLPPRRLGI